MHREPTITLNSTQLTFLTFKGFQLSQMACKPVGATALKWHKILSYAGPDAIKQLFKHINSAKLTELTNERVPFKIKCEVCLLAKHI